MGEGSDDNQGTPDRPDWPPSGTLWSELAELTERVRRSPLSGAWRRASEGAAKRLFEWWISAGESPDSGADELFDERQVQTTESDRHETRGDDEGRWVRLIRAAGSLLDAAKSAGEDLSAVPDGSQRDGLEWVSDETRSSLAESWRELRSAYPDMSEALLRSFAEESNRNEGFKSPGRVVVTSEEPDEPVAYGDEDVSDEKTELKAWWSVWLQETPAIEELADRAVAVAFREVFGEADEFRGIGRAQDNRESGAEKAAGFMRALERTMMSVVDSTLLNDYPSDRKDDRDDHSPPDD